MFYHTSISSKSTSKKELLSVTVVKDHGLSFEDLKSCVQKELSHYCGKGTYTFIKHYSIPKALPKLDGLQYEKSTSQTKLTNRILLAGDIQLNGSLNAAMISGEKAALGVIQNLKSS